MPESRISKIPFQERTASRLKAEQTQDPTITAHQEKEGLLWSQWQTEQLKDLERYKLQNQKKYTKQFRLLNNRVEALIRAAHQTGNMEQEIEILEAIKYGFNGYKRMPGTMQAEFFRVNERKLEALIRATTNDMQKAERLYHSRCKDAHTTYFLGISNADDTWTKEELEKVGLGNQEETKRQYAERQAEKYERMANYLLDEEDKKQYQIKAEKWKKTENSFSDQNDLGRIFKGGNKEVENTVKEFYHSLTDVKDDNVYQLLRQAYSRVQIKSSGKRKSYFSPKDRTIYLAGNVNRDAIAHELFHEIERTYGITGSGMLKKEISMDYARLKKLCSRKSIQGMLYSKYPDIFEDSMEILTVKPEYRGISDIIHGMTEGRVNLGYRHSAEYWKRPGSLQRETWAQYGRMYYSGDENVMAVLKDIFPETTSEFNRIIEAVIK